ncbi:MAG TPA: malonyl-CoA decarboxylase family protein [Gemmatimonadaceae bacterium]|nr:malonyl-CoA decarboxylase family protein [Gemmatimonadaceae bacterium]
MTDAGITAFLEMLANDLVPDEQRVEAAIRRWHEERNQGSLVGLADAVESPRKTLFSRLSAAPGGTRALVDLRAHLLDLLPERSGLSVVDADLKHLFSSWFNRGFLQLQRISWDTPAGILELLIKYEAVHEIKGWDDLRRRLSADRRCFALFHPALPNDPLVFVEVALTEGAPDKIRPLIDPGPRVADPVNADTATFYSISNCQRGLSGISFGSYLIKRVVRELSAELRAIRTYVTLSPVPGFAAALAQREDAGGFTATRLRRLIGDGGPELMKNSGATTPVVTLDAWFHTGAPRNVPLERTLRRLALAYLMHIRARSRVADPVAHFHLSNGARLIAIHAGADPTPNGRASAGVMVNYLYELTELERNRERYAESGRIILGAALSREARRVEEAWGAK